MSFHSIETKKLISYLITEYELDINAIDLEDKTILFHSNYIFVNSIISVYYSYHFIECEY